MKVSQKIDGMVFTLPTSDEFYIGEGVANCDGYISRQEAIDSGEITGDYDEVLEALMAGDKVVAIVGDNSDEFFLIEIA